MLLRTANPIHDFYQKQNNWVQFRKIRQTIGHRTIRKNDHWKEIPQIPILAVGQQPIKLKRKERELRTIRSPAPRLSLPHGIDSRRIERLAHFAQTSTLTLGGLFVLLFVIMGTIWEITTKDGIGFKMMFPLFSHHQFLFAGENPPTKCVFQINFKLIFPFSH